MAITLIQDDEKSIKRDVTINLSGCDITTESHSFSL